MNILLQILNLILVFVITYFHAEKVWKNEVITISFYVTWAGVNTAVMLLFQTFSGWSNVWLIVAMLLGAILFYAPFLNLQRLPKKDWLYMKPKKWYKIGWLAGITFLTYINICKL